MKELKLKYESLKALSKEMMKMGNISEYFNLLTEMNLLQKSIVAIK